MQQAHVPSAGIRYWTALSIASVFGANCGDFVARYLKAGHAGGLVPLAILLALVFVAERRDKRVRQVYYWLAIIIVRTAATNLADFGAGDLRIDKALLIGGLTVLLALTLLISRPTKSLNSDGVFALPDTEAKYWTAMLVAGTLGTVIGDVMSFGTGLGTLYASLVEGAVLAVAFLLGARGLFANVWFYWLTIVTVRATGTSVGDFLAHDLGLAISTLVTGIVFVVTLWAWKETPRDRRVSGDAD